MGHNTELYCTQSTVRRGVEKQIKLQQTHGMQRRGGRGLSWIERGCKSLQTYPAIKSMQNFRLGVGDSAVGGGAMLFVRKGRGRVWAIGWSVAQCWVPCSLTFFVSPYQ